MKRIKRTLVFGSLLLATSIMAIGQQGATPTPAQINKTDNNPIYSITVNVVERSTTAINYQQRNGATTIDFKGTPLLPEAEGWAKVQSKQGYTEIDAEFYKLEPATRYGPEYLTYVLWSVSPEGRAKNLGEVILDGSKSELEVTTDIGAFGLIVTAEPYFAVTQPSDVVVMENLVRKDTRGQVEQINAKYELLQRGQYSTNTTPSELQPIQLDKNTPLDLYQARNAVRIARSSGAANFAADSLAKAEGFLKQAEDEKTHKKWKAVSTSARHAVQTAEDARLIALKRIADDRLARERSEAAAREAEAQARTERTRQEAEQQAAQLRAQAEQERLRAAAEAQKAEADSARALEQAKLETQRAEASRLAAAADAERARQLTAQAERDKQALRIQLTQQLNAILQTRDSARGLIVSMDDVLFDTGKYELKPQAREKLAKISGIVLAHPGLKLTVEGHTDSVGSDQLNQKLSEDRANSVRSFLIQQGVDSSAITSNGFGKTHPIASNDTESGRRANRRVEMIVAGEAIGTAPNAVGGN